MESLQRRASRMILSDNCGGWGIGRRNSVRKSGSRATALQREKRPRNRGLFLLGAKIGAESYQLSLRANWNWRASKAAVGWPAAQTGPAVGSQSWFTAAMLVRLKRLKASAMRSRRKRSPKLMPLETRRSN